MGKIPFSEFGQPDFYSEQIYKKMPPGICHFVTSSDGCYLLLEAKQYLCPDDGKAVLKLRPTAEQANGILKNRFRLEISKLWGAIVQVKQLFRSFDAQEPQPEKNSTGRFNFSVLLILAVLTLTVFSFMQFTAIRSLQGDINNLTDDLFKLQQENGLLLQRHDEISAENEELQRENEQLVEENRMLRSSIIIYHGNRETDKVAITIDDGNKAELIHQTLDHLKKYRVKATLFPIGYWVDKNPEVWRRAVEEGHELGNHTYSHVFLTTISEDRIREELILWQNSVNKALGYPYKTYFFRPPGADGFLSINSAQTKRYQEIIAEKGMFPILWDVELIYALRNEVTTTHRIIEHVLANARGGSIVLLHFTEHNIAALPEIITGLRDRGLEPSSLRELLLAEPQI